MRMKVSRESSVGGIPFLVIVCCLPVCLTMVTPSTSSSSSSPSSPGGHGIVPGVLLAHHPLSNSLNDNLTSSSASAEVSEEQIPVKKPPAVKFASPDGQAHDEETSPEEFRDQQQKILRREHETKEDLLRQAEEQKQLRESCFHVPEEFCEFNNFTAELPPEHLKPLCPCKPHPNIPLAIICCNVTNVTEARNCYNRRFNQTKIGQQIHMRNATLKELDLNLGWWKNFNRISVTDGKINKLVNSFKEKSRLTCFNVSNNNITAIDQRMFKSVQGFNFTVLDMSENNITQVPNLMQFPNLTLNIRGNTWMPCKMLHEVIVQGLNLAARNHSYCQTSHTSNWFNYSAVMAVSQVYLEKELQMVCPKNCSCDLDHMSFNSEEPSFVGHTVMVNCINMGFHTLPEYLPAHTVFLNMSYNNITNLRHLSNHESLIRLILDNNQITNLLDMEGTTFKYDYQIFSLRNNKLKQIPTYILALDRNPLGKSVYLEGNKLACDCKSATELRMWIYAHKKSLDYNKIACENKELVFHMDEEKWCQSQHDAFDYIFYLIAIEVLLLMVLIMKVSYDYYVFKTQSYLPWPASKMPRLPCDWLCES